MHLADEEVTITLDDERIHLRPSLRAAVRIERHHGGFLAVMKAVEECSLTVIAALIRECAADPTTAPARIFEPGGGSRVHPFVPSFKLLVVDLMGDDFGPKSDPKPGQDDEPPMTFAEAHERLFRIGTGWLGWTPAETWAASPRELKQAFEGQQEKLRAIYGGGKDKPSDRDRAATADERFASGIRAIGTKKVARTA